MDAKLSGRIGGAHLGYRDIRDYRDGSGYKDNSGVRKGVREGRQRRRESLLSLKSL